MTDIYLTETQIRLLQYPLSDKIKLMEYLCAWCDKIGKTEDGKYIYFEEKDKEIVRNIFDSAIRPSHGICIYCAEKEMHPNLKNHIEYLEDRL